MNKVHLFYIFGIKYVLHYIFYILFFINSYIFRNTGQIKYKLKCIVTTPFIKN